MDVNQSEIEKELQKISEGDFGVRDQLMRMVEGSYENSGLDPKTFMLVRIGALVASDAPPASWLLNLGIGKELEMTAEMAMGAIIAVAPIVGTTKVVSAAGNILRALALARKMNEDKE